MGREPREEVEGGIHHVYARGNRRQEIFVDDPDRMTYLMHLRRVVTRCRWGCLAYCLMDNHVHLLIETPEANLGPGMQRLHGPYAQAFNARHRKVGHLFQGRYGAERVEDDAQLVTTLRYIALNPVEAGLCADPRDWPWSSYALLVEGIAPEWVDGARVGAYLASWGAELERVAG
jgi:REP element-mobilizing transposase RayT